MCSVSLVEVWAAGGLPMRRRRARARRAAAARGRWLRMPTASPVRGRIRGQWAKWRQADTSSRCAECYRADRPRGRRRWPHGNQHSRATRRDEPGWRLKVIGGRRSGAVTIKSNIACVPARSAARLLSATLAVAPCRHRHGEPADALAFRRRKAHPLDSHDVISAIW